jgi:glycyl-tRNA synthetase
MVETEQEEEELQRKALKYFNLRAKDLEQLKWDGNIVSLTTVDDFSRVLGPDAKEPGTQPPHR